MSSLSQSPPLNEHATDIRGDSEVENEGDENFDTGYDSSDVEDEPPFLGPSLWRLPPSESFSDFTLKVVAVVQDELDEFKLDLTLPRNATVIHDDQYHVHKAYLSAGPCKCDFFVSLFQRQNQITSDVKLNDAEAEVAEEKSQTIYLNELVAASIPIMLDYLYYQSSNNVVTDTRKNSLFSPQTAVALHSLGKLFYCRRLQWDAKQYCFHDMQVDNCHIYYQHATVFRDEKLIDAIVKTCASDFLVLQPSCSILSIANIDFWERVLEQLYMTNEIAYHYAREIVCELCTLHMDHLTAEQFYKLTETKYLLSQHMNGIAASALLEMNECFQNDDDENTTLSNLQSRCIDALAADWVQLARAENRYDFLTRLGHRPFVTAALLHKVVINANAILKEDKQEIDQLRQVST